jgi:hypothetical protein
VDGAHRRVHEDHVELGVAYLADQTRPEHVHQTLLHETDALEPCAEYLAGWSYPPCASSRPVLPRVL